MLKSETILRLINERIDTQSRGFRSFHKRYCDWIQVIRALLCLAFILVLFAVPAEAGMVYGRVYCDGCDLPQQITFTVTNEAKNNEDFSVTTDNNRNYSMFLPPGIYRVEVTYARNKKWRARIRSYSNPIREDIYLEEMR
jgi:hypothetical protein